MWNSLSIKVKYFSYKSLIKFKRFILPNQNEPTDQSWYSFDYGSIHFIFMSTEHDFRVQSSQYNWIQKDLSSVNRKKTPWIIFSGHRYSFFL